MQESIEPSKPTVSKCKPLPPLEFLQECFELIHETGQLIWKKRPLYHFKNAHGMRIHHSRWSGKEAGHIWTNPLDGAQRRLVVMVPHGKFMTHRVIFVMSGEPDPGELQVDHIDRNPLNNRRDNLRIATNQMNNANVGRKVFMGRVRHLPKGVYPNGKNKWQAKIKVNYKVKCLGTYSSPEEASAAYMRAAKEHFGEYARQD